MTLLKRLFSLVLVIAIIGNLGWVLPLSAFAESQEIVDKIKTSRKADICFVIDSTGSMSSYINSVVQNLYVFIDKLAEYNIDLEMSLLEFKDVTADNVAWSYYSFSDRGYKTYLTPSGTAMKDALKSLSIYGGGDNDETPTNSLIEWKGRNEGSHFVFLLTDADYKEADGDKIVSMENVVKYFKDKQVLASVVSKKTYKDHYKNLYEATNGIFIDIDSGDYSDLMLQVADWVVENTAELKTGRFSYMGFSSKYDNEADFYYSDGYFYEDSREYNNHLATMSMNLCMAITCTNGKEAKDNKSYEDWINRTNSIETLFGDIGFDGFDYNSFLVNEPYSDSIGAVAANKKIQMKTETGTKDYTLIALVVRGFGYYSEWGGNFRVGEAGLHTGFYTCATNVITFLKQYIISQEIKGPIKLWITGYSRAGATANMVAGFLDGGMKNGVFTGGGEGRHLPDGVTLAFNDLYAYAFEPPMGVVESPNSKTHDYSNIHNIVNVNDIVPKVALEGWGFTRYNKNGSGNYIIPNISSAHYSEAKKEMLAQYRKIKIDPFDYEPLKNDFSASEYPYMFYIDVTYNTPEKKSLVPNPALMIVSPGVALIESASHAGYNLAADIEAIDIDIGVKQDKKWTTDGFLYYLLEYKIGSFIPDRRSYVNSYQDAIVNLLSDLGSAKFDMNIFSYASNLLILIDDALTDHEFFYKVYSPIALGVAPNKLKPMIIKSMYDVLKKQIASNPYKYKESDRLLTFAEEVLLPLAADLLIQDPEMFMSTILTFTRGNAVQVHQGYVTLAWLRSQDSYYTDTPPKVYLPNILRILRINCPVDVVVYDSNGEKVAEISSKNPISYGYIGCDINENDEIVITLPADESYRAEILPTDNGEMSFSVDEYNMLYGDYTRILNYYDVSINKGNKLYADIPALPESEYAYYHKASSVKYKLTRNNGEVISPSQEITSATDVGQYHIDVSASNAGGVVTGGGSFVSGSFSKVKASPFLKNGFLGWYEGDKLVSNDLEYRFLVTGDRKLVAKFVAPVMSKLNVKSTEGGFIFDWSGEYPVGLVLPLHAEPDKGYKFKGWSVDDGTIVANSAVKDLDFIVPETETTLTAIFVDENAEEYKFTSSAGSRWIKKSKDTLNFTVNGNIDAFDSILIDNNKIYSNGFTVSGPTITIQLKPSLLETLSVGEHTITAKMKDGDCTTYFFIVDAIPHTGDDGHIVEWGVVGISMALLLVLIAVKAKKKQHVA